MPESTLQVTIKAKDKASREIKGIGKSLKEFGGSLKAIGLNAGLAGAAVAGGVLAMAKMGAQSERVEKRFSAFAQAAGGATSILDAFQKGAGGAASKMEAMQSASKLLQMGLVQDANSMERVVEMATRLGDQTAGVGDRVQDFALMLSNMSIPRLDNFGISSGKVRARIEELQKSVVGMTRETAFMQAVMEEGGKSLDILGPRADDSAMAFEKMEAKVKDLTVSLGQALIPLALKLADALMTALDALTPWIEKLDSAIELIEGMAEESDNLEDKIRGAADGMVEGTEIAQRFADAANVTEDATGGLNESLLEMGKTFLGTASRSDLLTSATEGLNARAIAATDSYTDYLAIIDEYNSLVTNSSLKVVAMTEAERAAAIAGGEWVMSLIAQGQAMADMAQEAEQADAIMLRNVATLTQQRTAMDVLSGVTAGAYQAISRTREAQQESLLVAGAASTAFSGLASAVGSVADSYRAGEAATGAMAAVQSIAVEALALSRQAAIANADAYVGLAMSMKGATEQQIAQGLIGMLDPEAMGAEAFTAAAIGIGTQFGLMDEKSIALAASLPLLADAISQNIIPAENAAEALGALMAEAATGNVEMGTLLEKFGAAPAVIDPTTTSLSGINDILPDVHRNTMNVAGAMRGLGEDGIFAAGEIGILKQRLEAIEGEYVIDVKINIPNVNLPAYASGGTVPGPVGQPQLAIVHGGEEITPASGGGGGGSGSGGRTYVGGASTRNYNISTPAALDRLLDDERRRDRRELERMV